MCFVMLSHMWFLTRILNRKWIPRRFGSSALMIDRRATSEAHPEWYLRTFGAVRPTLDRSAGVGRGCSPVRGNGDSNEIKYVSPTHWPQADEGKMNFPGCSPYRVNMLTDSKEVFNAKANASPACGN